MKITLEKKADLMSRWDKVMGEIFAISEEMRYSSLGCQALGLSYKFHNKLNKLSHVKAKTIDEVIAETDDDSGEEWQEDDE